MFTRIEITSMGPLRNINLDLGQCNLIIGRNESGKTSIADLLAAGLARGFKGKNQIKEFQKITGVSFNRFGGNWKARVVGDADGIADEGEAKDAIVDALSLLVIRANRNEIVNKNDADIASLDFWKTTVKNMLAGSNVISKKISAIKTYVNTGARIWKIKDYFESYLQLLRNKKDEIDLFKNNVTAAGHDSDALRSIDTMLDESKKNRDAAEYKRRFSIYKKYMEVKSGIASIEEGIDRYNVEDLLKKSIAWQDADARLAAMEKTANEIRVNRVKTEETLSGIEKNISASKRQKEDLAGRLAGKKDPGMEKRDFQSERIRLDRQKAEAEKTKKRMPVIPLIVIILGLISLLGIVIYFPFIVVSIGLIMLGCALFVLLRSSIEKEAGRRIEEIVSLIIENESQAKAFEATEAGEINEADRLRKDINKINLEIDREQERAKAARQAIDAFLKDEKETVRKTDAAKKEIADFIAELKDKTYLGRMIEEIKSRQKTLAKLKSEIPLIEKEIKTAFGVDSVIPADILARLELEKANISFEFIEKQFDPKKYDELLARRESIVNKGHGYDKEFAEMKGSALKELEANLKKATEASSSAMSGFYSAFFVEIVESLAVDSIYDLDPAIEACMRAIEKTGRYKEYAEFLYSVVSSMESKQETLIRSITNDAGFIDSMKHVMGYSRIETAIGEDGVLFSFGNDGYPLDDLSTGALHQFNLLFRFALLKRIFKKPATIVLDDAFLHFDRERRNRACELLLHDFADKGWQFIYTAIDDGAIENVFRSVIPQDRLVVNKIG